MKCGSGVGEESFEVALEWERESVRVGMRVMCQIM